MLPPWAGGPEIGVGAWGWGEGRAPPKINRATAIAQSKSPSFPLFKTLFPKMVAFPPRSNSMAEPDHKEEALMRFMGNQVKSWGSAFVLDFLSRGV